jgi:hypothetical protein
VKTWNITLNRTWSTKMGRKNLQKTDRKWHITIIVTCGEWQSTVNGSLHNCTIKPIIKTIHLNPGNGGTMFLQNIGICPPPKKKLHVQTNQKNHHHENLKTFILPTLQYKNNIPKMFSLQHHNLCREWPYVTSVCMCECLCTGASMHICVSWYVAAFYWCTRYDSVGWVTENITSTFLLPGIPLRCDITLQCDDVIIHKTEPDNGAGEDLQNGSL